MTDRGDFGAAWQAAGTDWIQLPSGVEMRGELPVVADLLMRGALPTALRAIALRFASDEGVDESQLDSDAQAAWEALQRQLIHEAFTAARWTCACPECVERRAGLGIEPLQERPRRIPLEDLEADPPRMPRIDLAALRDMVIRARSPKQVDAMSRVAHGQMGAAEAAVIVERERRNTIEAWGSFRGDRGGVPAGADGEDVGQPSVAVRDHLGSGGRVRPRRGRRAATRSGKARPNH